MKSTLLILNVYVQSTIILDSFNGRQLLFVNPVHEFPRFPFFSKDFLNFSIKEGLFSILDHFLELLPVINTLSQPIFLEVLAAIIVPPTFEVLSNIDKLQILFPYSFYEMSKSKDDVFE